MGRLDGSSMMGLEWGLLAIALCLVGLLAWLGLTVLLTAERRHVFVWLVGLAMLVGAAVFALYAFVISHGIDAGASLALCRWPLAWVAGLLQPSAWYLAILWHAGFWEPHPAMRHRRLHAVAVVGLLVIWSVGGILVFSDPLVRAHPLLLLTTFNPAVILAGPYLGSVPVLAIVYLLLMLACIVLALDALYHPGPTHRLMGRQARARARPWLVATTLVLLAVGLLVGGVVLRFMPELLFIETAGVSAATAHAMAWIDLTIALLVAAAVFLIGQAVVSYEIFTGKALARQGLKRRWLEAVLLSAASGMLLSAVLVFALPPIAGALLVPVLVAVAYALATWRGFAEHERLTDTLRQWHTAPRLYPRVVAGDPADDGETVAFAHLCGQVLGVQSASLWPLGPLSSLLQPLAYPTGSALPPPAPALASIIHHISNNDSASPTFPCIHDSSGLAAQFTSSGTLCLPLHPEDPTGAQWAVPLWSERGLAGLLLLGPKHDHGLGTQEEMEIARAMGERLLDGLASAELARRLLQVQRAHLAESQVIDQRTRRALHDEVLPQVHALMLALSGGQMPAADANACLAEIHRQIAAILQAMPTAGLTGVATHGVLGALRQFVTLDCRDAFAAVQWEIAEEAEAMLATIPTLTAEVLYGAAREAVRNAARHAAGGTERPVSLRIAAHGAGGARLVIEDDGVGLRAPATSHAGAGRGIALHGTMMAVIGGSWESEPAPDAGTRVTLTFPASG